MAISTGCELESAGYVVALAPRLKIGANRWKPTKGAKGRQAVDWKADDGARSLPTSPDRAHPPEQIPPTPWRSLTRPSRFSDLIRSAPIFNRGAGQQRSRLQLFSPGNSVLRPQIRKTWKFNLMRQLYDRGMSSQDIRNL